MVAIVKTRDWIHCEGPPENQHRFPNSITACGRAPSEGLETVGPRQWGQVDCPTCHPIAYQRSLELEADERRPEWLRELRKVEDAAPFLPVLAEELKALGAGAVDWATDVVSRRGFYVMAIRKHAKMQTIWVRYRKHSQYVTPLHDEGALVQIALELPGDRNAFITVSPEAGFIAAAIMSSFK